MPSRRPAPALAALILSCAVAGGGAAGPAVVPAAIDARAPVGFEAGDPTSVAELLAGLGYEVEREVEEDPPALFAQIDGIDLALWFYGCRGGTRCRELIFEAVFDVGEGLSLRAVNEWNRDAMMGRAYLDDYDDAVIEHHLVVEGGVGRANFERIVALWGEAVAGFADHLGR